MNKAKLFKALLFMYVLSIAFQDFMRLPGVLRKVQLPEILFLLLLVTFPFSYLRQYRFERADRFLIGILSVYWLANAVSSVLSGHFSAIAESGGRLYLIILFAMTVMYLNQLSKTDIRRQATFACIGLGILLALTGIFGTLSSLAGFPSLMADESLDYPYLGTVFRAQGFTHTPAMMVSIFSIIVVVAAADVKGWLSKKWIIFSFGLMLIATLFTLSRSMVLLFWGLGLLIFFQKKGFSSKVFAFTAFATALIMTIGTHFIFISKNDPKLPALLNTQFTSNRVLFERGDFEVLETCYLSMKQAAVTLWLEKPLFGIGTGNFTEGVDRLKTTGMYPKKLPSFEPHSSYLGALAENGIFAALSVLAFFGILWHQINRFDNFKTEAFTTALLICLIIVIIESLALDTMNFRHYWLMFALIWAYTKKLQAAQL
jgi:hypothetical protein